MPRPEGEASYKLTGNIITKPPQDSKPPNDKHQSSSSAQNDRRESKERMVAGIDREGEKGGKAKDSREKKRESKDAAANAIREERKTLKREKEKQEKQEKRAKREDSKQDLKVKRGNELPHLHTSFDTSKTLEKSIEPSQSQDVDHPSKTFEMKANKHHDNKKTEKSERGESVKSIPTNTLTKSDSRNSFVRMGSANKLKRTASSKSIDRRSISSQNSKKALEENKPPAFAVRGMQTFTRRKSLNELDLTRLSTTMQEIILRSTSAKNLHAASNSSNDQFQNRVMELSKMNEAPPSGQIRGRNTSLSSSNRARYSQLGKVSEADSESKATTRSGDQQYAPAKENPFNKQKVKHSPSAKSLNAESTKGRKKNKKGEDESNFYDKIDENPKAENDVSFNKTQNENDKKLGKDYETRQSAKYAETGTVKREGKSSAGNYVSSDYISPLSVLDSKHQIKSQSRSAKQSNSGAPNVRKASENEIIPGEKDKSGVKSQRKQQIKPVESIRIPPEDTGGVNKTSAEMAHQQSNRGSASRAKSVPVSISQGQLGSTGVSNSSSSPRHPTHANSSSAGPKNVLARSHMCGSTQQKQQQQTQQQLQQKPNHQKLTPRENERLLIASISDSNLRYSTFAERRPDCSSTSCSRADSRSHRRPKNDDNEQRQDTSLSASGSDSSGDSSTSADDNNERPQEPLNSGSNLDMILQQARSALLDIGKMKAHERRFLNVKIDLSGLRDVNVI